MQIRHRGYVADISDDVDASELDFESTDYCETNVALVSPQRIRLEWMEGEELWAVTINDIHEDSEAEYCSGVLECIYLSWEGRRNIKKRETGRVSAILIVDDDEKALHVLDEFWIDVNWTTGPESGRFLFELTKCTN